MIFDPNFDYDGYLKSINNYSRGYKDAERTYQKYLDDQTNMWIFIFYSIIIIGIGALAIFIITNKIFG